MKVVPKNSKPATRKHGGSEGIFFVVRLPRGWELKFCCFDQHSECDHPEFWEEHVTPMLVNAWAPHLFTGINRVERRRNELRLKSEIELHYDGFPRGRVTWVQASKQFIVYHGDNLKPAMKVTRLAVEEAFGIAGCSAWQFDEHEQCSLFSAEGLRSELQLRENWKTITPNFN